MESECGWIVPGATVARYGGNLLSAVAAFKEKPRANEINRIQKAGGLRSTFIIIGKVKTFFALGTNWIPKVINEFYRYQSTVDTGEENMAIESLLESIKIGDFSNDVLRQVPICLAVFRLNDLHWSKLGRPEHIKMGVLGQKFDREQSRL
ncbi:MAG: hypothetical protein ABIJ45_00780 [Candidatus Zixiibacteriota bacterium]